MKGKSSQSANVSDMFHKYVNLGHLMRDFPMQKMEYKEYSKSVRG